MFEVDWKKKYAQGRIGKFKPENPRVKKILVFIAEFKEVRDYSPNVREMGDAAGIPSTSVVMYYLRKLQYQGMLDFNYREARTIRLTKQGKEYVAGLLKVENPNALKRRVSDLVDAP